MKKKSTAVIARPQLTGEQQCQQKIATALAAHGCELGAAYEFIGGSWLAKIALAWALRHGVRLRLQVVLKPRPTTAPLILLPQNGNGRAPVTAETPQSPAG